MKKPLGDVAAFARQAYGSKTDKGGDLLYNHACRVAVQVSMTIPHMAIGLLHDVIEDTDETYRQVERLVGTDLADKVHILTRSRHDSYVDYIHKVTKDPMCRTIKIADIADHLEPVRVGHLSDSMVARYHKAAMILTQAVSH